ncbi:MULTISPECIES: hypothetical protein [Bradyrhizobium]|jgi:hypothetical protein|uniref:Uncharacterized protein n=2 Tax=Bradyrhizobium TaxID=374 RepID=A0ABY0QFF1_9BRAD|nr:MULTISPECIES: hypothetical protein [Bradyrhizobium]SDK13891.1 hypothetical protein SAMN05444163_7333 [Bradyrhizobium ottawaense]SEE51203.1 hypothetical protein SAMN05444171_7798 [Bradyrhizobium lablabi]SHM51619.1 hypothetical protein SAMN05444321_6599 [Bradyrhizobium lablabi]
MPGTTAAQEAAHKTNVLAAESARQTAIAAAKAAYNNTPAAWPAFDAAIKAADVAHCRAILASAALNGSDGPRQTLHELTGSWT